MQSIHVTESKKHLCYIHNITLRTTDNEYREILKNSIEAYESGRDKIFIMKDLASVEEAIEKGAVKCLFSSYWRVSGLASARPTVPQTGGDSNIIL